MKNLTVIYTIAFSLLCAAVPFTEHFQAVPNIMTGILAALFFFTVKKKDWKTLKNNSFICFNALLLIVLTGILMNQRFDDFSFLTKMLFVPVLYTLSIPIKDFKRPLYFFLVGSGALLLVSCINLSLYYLEHQSLKMDVGRKVNDLLMGERPYLGFIYLISFCISIYLTQLEKSLVLKRTLFISAFVFAGFIVFISARLSILSLVIILFSFIFFMKNKKQTLLISLTAFVAISLVVIFNPNFTKRFYAGFEQEEFNISKVIRLEPRYHIWNCALDIEMKNSTPLLGHGFRNTIENLTHCYTHKGDFENEEHKNYFIDSRFNTHNQFLNFYLSGGILSLALFCLFFLLLFKNNHFSYVSFALVLALFLFCTVENVLSRQLGAMLFGLVYVFINLIKNNVKLTSKSN